MKTKVVFNNIIPFKGFLAICLWPYIFVRMSEAHLYNVNKSNHEHIHAEQQKEMLCVGVALAVFACIVGGGLWSLLCLPIFLWWYCIEWLIRFLCCWNFDKAYRNISFEREAYSNEKDLDYLRRRQYFAWISYIVNK